MSGIVRHAQTKVAGAAPALLGRPIDAGTVATNPAWHSPEDVASGYWRLVLIRHFYLFYGISFLVTRFLIKLCLLVCEG